MVMSFIQESPMRVLRHLTLAVLFLCLAVPGQSRADDKHGTREEAQAMCEKAAELIRKEGPDKAFPILQSKTGGFVDRDLYVFIIDKDGTYMVHPIRPELVGTNRIDLKDPNGFLLIRAFVAIKDKAWVDYKWTDPSDNNKIKDKSSWMIRVGDYIVGVGYYH
jgi:cytochrome c